MSDNQLYELVITRTPIYGPRYFGRKYDLSKACPICFAGVKPTSEPIIDYAEAKRNPIVMAGSESILVSQKLSDVFEENELCGLALNPALDHKGRSLETTYYELMPAVELPPMASTSAYRRDEVCALCNRGGYTETGSIRTEIHYTAASLKPVPGSDFYRTWEFWGSLDWIPHRIYPKQLIIVGARVMDVLVRNKIRKVKFIPVRVDP